MIGSNFDLEQLYSTHDWMKNMQKFAYYQSLIRFSEFLVGVTDICWETKQGKEVGKESPLLQPSSEFIS